MPSSRAGVLAARRQLLAGVLPNGLQEAVAHLPVAFVGDDE